MNQMQERRFAPPMSMSSINHSNHPPVKYPRSIHRPKPTATIVMTTISQL